MVATWKKDTVGKLAKQIKTHRVFGVVGVSGVPSKQMQAMRKKLKGEADITVSRGKIIKRALDKAGVAGVDGYLQGPSGLIFSDLNPFQLERLIYSCRTKAPAKPGSTAPTDLIVPEGDTGLPAGPVIGDLQAAGVKAKIQGGKIVVTEDSLLVKAGQRVDEKVASVLTRLGVEPMEITLKLAAAYEDGTVYGGDILHIDEAETRAKLQGAHQKAFNLAYNARYFTKDVVELLVAEAAAKTRNLMVNAQIINSETIGMYLAKADAQAKALKSVLPEDLKAEVKEKAPAGEKEEQAPAGEKKEQAPAGEKRGEAPVKEKREDAKVDGTSPEEKKQEAPKPKKEPKAKKKKVEGKAKKVADAPAQKNGD
jgi:large subunit ribosomal protein L10